MNSTTNSTCAAETPAQTDTHLVKVASAMRALESDIRELMHMSDIAADAFDDVGVKVGEDTNSVTYRYTHHSIDQFAFLINNVASRASRLLNSFEAAYQGREAE